MADHRIYKFVIDGRRLETMPFGRLLEYYAQIKSMIGIDEGLHLVNLFDSSHGSDLAIDYGYVPNVEKRFMEINEGKAPKRNQKAFDNINMMLRSDETSATFASSETDNVINFPGAMGDEERAITVWDNAQIFGKYYAVVEADDLSAKARIKTEQYGVVYCELNKTLAKEMNAALFDIVRVYGRARWRRSAAGRWSILTFIANNFRPVERTSLRDAVNKIRQMDIEWPSDPIGELDRLKAEDGNRQ